MKKIFFLLFFLACGIQFTAAQSITYTPFIPKQSNQQPNQRVRATAYYIYNGNFYKMPIQVAIMSDNYGKTVMQVESFYRRTEYGGSWENCPYGGPVQTCRSTYGTSEIEQSFMYKAYIPNFGWIYFDL